MGLVLLVLLKVIDVYIILNIVYIFMSWVPGARESQFGDMLSRLCEPYLEQFRRIIPPLGMIDITPIVAIIALRLAQTGLTIVFGMF